MMSVRRILHLAFFLVVALSSALAQMATGTPPWSSLEGGPDAVNLGNLNVHNTFPVLHKDGRQQPFNFDLTDDSSFWSPTGGSWVPISGWGWGGSALNIGYFGYSLFVDGYGDIEVYNFVYLDGFGTTHFFGGDAFWDNINGIDYPLTTTAVDGSGYTLTADACFLSGGFCYQVFSLTTTAGIAIIPQQTVPLNPTASAGSSIDRNGNEITLATANQVGTFTDTLGTQVLKISGGNPNPYVLNYTPPAGTGVTCSNSAGTPGACVVVTFKSYTVQTNFGCANIVEYGPKSISLPDKITLPDGTFYQVGYETTPGDTHSPHYVTARVASITLPTGGTLSYDYSVGTNHGIVCKDGSTSGVKRTTPDGTWTYTRTFGTGAASTTTAIDPKGNNTVIQFQGIYETERQSYQGAIVAANLLQQVDTCYNNAAIPCTATAITLPVLQRTVQTQLGPSTAKVIAKKTFTYNTYGLMTEEDDYDWGPTAAGAVLRKRIMTYATNLGSIRDKAATVKTTDSAGTVYSQATMTYDEAGTLTATSGTPQHVTFTGPRGNLTTLAISANASTSLYRKFTFYDTGNPNTETAVSTSSTSTCGSNPSTCTTYNYAAGTASCGNSFATSVTEPLGLSRSMTWDCTGGVQLTSVDENGNATSSTYTDAFFWRPSKRTDAAQVPTLLTYTGAKTTESSMEFNSNASTVDVLTTLDGLGRTELVQIKQSPTATTYDSTETDYDTVGLPKRTTLPYSASAGATNSSAPATTTTYDGLNRPLQSSDSGGGTVSYTYQKNDVLVTTGPAPTGENTKRKQMEYDSLGRLTSVCELSSAAGSGTCAQNTSQTGFWTKYAHDPNGSITSVTQNAQAAAGSQQTRTYVYDRMTRPTQEQNPESGTWNYTYDIDSTCTSFPGELVKRVDALGNVTCYGYDSWHRNTTITYPSGPYASSTPSKTFIYDSTTFSCPAGQANVKSRLAEAFTGPSSAKITDLAFCYSPRGESSEVFEKTPNSAGTYSVPMTYWENGLLKTFGPFLTEDQVGYIPDGEGRVYSLHDFRYNNTMELQSTTYNPAGQATTLMTSCAGATCYPLNYTYDPNTLRMTQYSGAFSNGTLSGTLTWNPNGSLQKFVVADPVNPGDAQTCTYGSDDLGRIASANCGSVWSQTFTYDPFGNITKSGSISWIPGYNTATNRYALGGTSYDANGNVLNDTFNSYTWDAEGKTLSTHYSNGQTWAFTYDALGHMVELSINGAYDYSYLKIGKIRLSATGQTPAYSEFPLPAGNKYSQLGGATGLQLSDWLGTIRGFYSYTGGTLGATGSHAPFGEAYGYQGGYPQGFAGQGGTGWGQGDDGSMTNTTYWFPERQYRANQGRWLSPDPAGLDAVNPADPQTWNRYAYVRNSPLNLIDPKGLCDDWDPSCGWDDGWGDGGVWSEVIPVYLGPPIPISQIPVIMNLHTDDQGYGVGDYNGEPNTTCFTNPDVICTVWNADTQEWDFTPEDKRIKELAKDITQDTAAFTGFVNCAAAVAYPFLPGVKPEDVEDMFGLSEKGTETAADLEAEHLEEQVDQLRKWHKKSAPTAAAAKRMKWLGHGLTALGYAEAAKEAYDNLDGCQDR